MTGEDSYGSGGAMGGLTIGMPKPGQVVKVLLIINIAVFIIQQFADAGTKTWNYGVLSSNLGVTVSAWWQIWRYITFQFLHADFLHILLNMLGLYLIGTPVEQKYGSKKFLTFYLSCGVFAGLLYVVVGALYPEVGWDRPIIGASGGVFGILLAAAVYFPNFRLIFFLFPLPIRFACLLIFGGMTIRVVQGLFGANVGQAMSDVAHLGGTLMAAGWIWIFPSVGASADDFREKVEKGNWEKKMQARREHQLQIDRILEKIHQEGIQSLTAKEKRMLQKATKEQQKQDNKLHKL
ncbi:MAG: rhomboid family intramembrane serine protease [Phycisphaerae bacterium]